ncbi:hypothetical protein E2C01_030392 [Portunus trituberculatus]|uniref:Uncharacterized protein n=1 Tax=Portunus trituberculatus TaxID=210409 RepID=A0A5B7EX71_PORTR|nr:hypothetical protein [Portunus trituberculatus]
MHQLGSLGALSDYTMSGVKVCEAHCHLEGTEQAWRLTKGQTQLVQLVRGQSGNTSERCTGAGLHPNLFWPWAGCREPRGYQVSFASDICYH